MKKILAALGWLALFAALGAAAMLGLAAVLLPHRLSLAFVPGIAGTGAVPGSTGLGHRAQLRGIAGRQRAAARRPLWPDAGRVGHVPARCSSCCAAPSCPMLRRSI